MTIPLQESIEVAKRLKKEWEDAKFSRENAIKESDDDVEKAAYKLSVEVDVKYIDSLTNLITSAEEVRKASAQLPKKKEPCKDCPQNINFGHSNCKDCKIYKIDSIFNYAIDQCTPIFVRKNMEIARLKENIEHEKRRADTLHGRRIYELEKENKELRNRPSVGGGARDIG